ncbi:hypothetical protein [Streptantibioticus cattleyicolor]|nr:hypothetical protein [Streptantibioticus cattleyicolor]
MVNDDEELTRRWCRRRWPVEPDVPAGEHDQAERDPVRVPGGPAAVAGHDVWSAEVAVARIFRIAAERVPGVRTRGCRLYALGPQGPDDHTHPWDRLPRGSLRVVLELDLAARLTAREVVPAVREQVARLSGRLLRGIDLAAVDLLVVERTDEGSGPVQPG